MWQFIWDQLDWIVFAIFAIVAVVMAVTQRERLLTYVNDVRQEWGRASKPTRDEAQMHTVVVLVGVFISAIYLFVVDLILAPIIRLFYGG